ncbi:hypothetical protein BS78_06G053600 [Paspalum vaginatum]|nr:hypothetical protein BS78_06G053600 [Paspalum vaginatum]
MKQNWGTPTPLVRSGGSAGAGASRRSRAAAQEQDYRKRGHFTLIVRLPHWFRFLCPLNPATRLPASSDVSLHVLVSGEKGRLLHQVLEV